MTPNIDDIRRDDQLLDAIGARQSGRHTDPAAEVLCAWVMEIDAPDRPRQGGRYARNRHTRVRAGVLGAVTVGILSVSGVAAAVSGVPGIAQVARDMGFVHRSADFGSGAAGPVSTRPGMTPGAPGRATSTTAPGTWVGSGSTDPAALPRVLPGALQDPRGHGGSTTAGQGPKRSGPSTSPGTSSPSSSSSGSSSSSASSSPANSPTRKPHPTKPPHPTKSPSPTGTTSSPPSSPVSSPSGTAPSGTASSSSTVPISGSTNPTSTSDAGK